MKIYIFGMNWNPLNRCEESFLTTIKIPATSDEEASKKLVALTGKRAASKCFLNDCYAY